VWHSAYALDRATLDGREERPSGEIISVLMDEVICPGVERKPRDPKQWNQSAQRNAPGVAECCVNVAWAVVHVLRNTSRLLVLGDGLPRSGAPGSPSCSTRPA